MNLELETWNSFERQRLERSLARERHEAIYSLVMREAARQSQNPKHTTTRTEQKVQSRGTREAGRSKVQSQQSETTTASTLDLGPGTLDSESHDEPMKLVKTVRDTAVNVQLYKVAQRSAIELQKLAELQPLPSPEAQRTTDRRTLIERLLTEVLGDGIAAGKIRSTGWSDEQEFVEDLMKFLMGEPHRGLATNIIAADAEHGRFRDQKCGYPGRDPMRVGAIPLPSGEGAERSEAGEGLNALTNAKPTPANANARTTDEPLMNPAVTPSDAATSDPRRPAPDSLPRDPSVNKNSMTFSAPRGTVIYLGPADQAEFDRMFHPWTREF